ncbi:RsmB/NOP family class I SAM-dependent RNA methyltransferase [Aestuariivirga sp.]|uniref:RsmB/NOP family class I SAM-dependent RNA methyltransferase n=1 Tax=Aestuariivirga sp. TaxID=2650926 RepID=UPI0025C1B5C2|nr:RsmB/NOP family class I SAM-dependent RNA methyltransferase [Aestuariivirga sp.]MCA3556574.1 RsmB/NOP family class I SAM-dependent RNA methyltransferase [Aestuariivirga sp.]
MRLAGRVSAAIDVLTGVIERHRPASEALKDWGKAHRFAGSGDRHAIGTLVFDALRRRNSLAWRMGTGTPRALALAGLRDVWGLSADAIGAMAEEQHGPGMLTAEERQALSRQLSADLPVHVAGDVPEWLAPSYRKAFGPRAAEEGAALARRAPVDLRVNTLKATRPQVLEALERFGAAEGPWSPLAVRIAATGPDTRNANVEAETAHGMGWFEVQDAGSQVAAFLSGVQPGMRVADICAGAGGKTLALAAMMRNGGHLVAHDLDRFRLRPIFERLSRAGAANCEVIPAQDRGRLEAAGPFDCVVIDAPCSGSGSWRRKPDAKWRLTPKQLAQRLKDQAQLLEKGFQLAKPGGTVLYITCSVLPEENTEQLAAFLTHHRDMRVVPYKEVWERMIGGEAPVSADGSKDTLLLTPARHDTDGFFVAVMKRG